MSALTILAEECELLNDSKYRSYISQVDKALKNFEYTSEWADLISALGKLNKVLVGHTKYPVIPKRVTIGKRLAQCLHPALPSGVHLKALETYDIIFKCIGTQRLAQDLFIYSAGLFPLLGHAAMSVKPSLLTLYERHFIALGKHIKPGLNGLLLGLLPGLEEGSEFHDRTNLLLEDFCQAANFEYFYTCLWECVLSCPSVRLPAITYLLLHYNKKKTMEDQLYMMGLNIDLMVEAVCSAIQDVNVLVQRSLLDFLLLAFPMHNGQLTKADMGKIVKAVVNVVLRRDMSLNRRLYSWLLGTGVSPSVTMAITPDVSRQQHSDNVSTSSETDLSYFYTFSQDLLIHALKLKLSTIDKNDYDGKGNSGKLSILNPFRILMSLLDKPEIGPVILESVLLSVFRCLYRECESYQHSNDKGDIPETEGKNGKRTKTDDKESKTYGELIKTSNLLFGAFEPYFIWDYIARMFETSCQEKASGRSLKRSTSLQETEIPELPELCTLVDFLLDVVSLETFLETQTEHLPDLLFRITTTLNQHCDYISDADIKSTLKLCTKLLSKVQPSMNVIGVDAIVDDDTQDAAVQEVSINDIQILKSKQNDIEIIVKETSDFVEVTKSDGSSSNLQKKTETNNNNGTADTTEIKQVAVSKEKRSSTSSIKSTKKGLRTAYPLNLIQACVEQFQVFFHTFVSRRILQDDNLSAKCLEMITVPSGNIKFSDSDSLLDSDSFCSYEDAPSSHIYDQLPLSSCQLSEERIHTFKSACKLLLDFSSVPIFCTDFQKVLKRTESKDEETVPVWLQDLIACICVVSNFEVQSTATASMLDLILLCQTVQSQSENKDEIDHSKSSTGGTVSVVILPALPPRHLKYLGDHTVFYKTLAQILWDYLDSSTPCHHRRSVELFHLLHQVAPSAWICEDVIGNSLVMDDQSARIEAFKRFTILWHLTRESKVEVNPGHSSRTFDRSMFVVLDSLKEDCSPVKTITSTWLTHLIQRSDISRVLDPILQMILHPDTARVSVQHVNIHKPRKVQISESSEDSSEARIYAISSSAGNVIYHVASERKKYRGRSDTEFVSHSIVMNEKGSTSTAPDNSLVNEELIFEKVKPDDLNLRINPWGSESSIDRVCDGIDLHLPAQQADLGSAKRLDKETCTKEGIFFDSEESSLKSEEVELTAQDIVQDILDMIVDRVVELDENDELDVANDDQKDSEVGLTGPSNNPVNLVSRSSSVLEDQDLLNSIDRREMDIDSLSSGETDVNPRVKDELTENTNIHPLHMHMLLYTQKFDCRRTSYALTTLKSMLVTCPRLVVTAMVTTSISAVRPSQLAKLQMLLSRHRKSVFGNNFYGELTPDVMSSYRSNMFIEILISICLYFVRSYYPNLMVSKMSQEELHANKEVHILATEVLTLLISELIVIMKESGKSFMSYIKDLLNRCKLQKALLHCCLATVFNSRKKNQRDTVSMVTEAIVEFNEDNLDPSANETFQIRLLNLLLAVIILEGNVEKIQGDVDPVSPTVSTEWERPKVNFHQSLLNAKFLMNKPIVQQGMFMSCVLSALKQKHLCHLHRHWIAVVTSSLPYMGKSLTNIIMSVVSQLCRNLESFAATYERNENDSTTNLVNLPPDHIVTLLEGLTTLCHYCLLDNLSPVSVGMVGLPAPSITNITPDTGSAGQILTNLIHVFNPISGSRETSPQRDAGPSPVLEARRGLLSIMPRIIACMTSMWKAVKSAEQLEEGTETWIMGNPKVIKQCILEFVSPISLPHGTHLLGAVGVAWNDRRKKIAGPNKKVLSGPCEEQLLLVHLVRDIKVLPTDTLVQTVTKVLKQPPATEMDRGKISQIERGGPVNLEKGIALEVNMLQFFFAYVQHTPVSQLIDSWSSLLTLLRDGMQLNLSPPGKFILLQILNEFVQKMPMLDDKKNQKDLQDITQRLLEMVSMIAGSSLEQTTWLRRNLAVKPGPQKAGPLEIDEEDISESDAYEKPAPTRKERRDIDPKLTNAIDSKYSVQALVLLAELTSPLLDVVYTSDEKDKVAPFLVTILYNVFPYLRNHSYHNVPSFRACSQILNSISGYQYTRKAWRKEALELLLDSSFFQMDVKCIGYWRSIIDNLMTHDKTTFKDLMNRVTITQSGSLNLFSSKEQELEQKAQMLKRLAFTIFCSDPDQYQKCMPEIQERLADSLRVPHQAPSIMAQVFLCVRVLILRMSVHQLTSLWPTVITEMVHVFMQIEQELSNDTDEFKVSYKHSAKSRTQIQRIAALDSSWAHLGNGFNAHNNPAWLQLYLSVCKLLDLALALPADVVPQFQLYRWAFIGGVAAGTDSDREEDSDDGEDDKKNEKKKDDKKKKHKQPKFTPHIIRLAKLVNEKVRGATPILKQTPGRPLLTQTYLRSLVELQPFFNTLCFVGQSETNFNMTSQSVGRTQDKKSNKKKSLDVSGQTLMSKSKSSPAAMDKLSIGPNDGPSSKQYKSNISFIEEMIERDFLEPLPKY